MHPCKNRIRNRGPRTLLLHQLLDDSLGGQLEPPSQQPDARFGGGFQGSASTKDKQTTFTVDAITERNFEGTALVTRSCSPASC
jgi:hypothetical protein